VTSKLVTCIYIKDKLCPVIMNSMFYDLLCGADCCPIRIKNRTGTHSYLDIMTYDLVSRKLSAFISCYISTSCVSSGTEGLPTFLRMLLSKTKTFA
jgi:hypothetical protein